MNSNIIFFSKNNYVLGERIRRSLRRFNSDVTYCNDLKSLILKIIHNKNNIVLIDKEYKKYANFVSQLVVTTLSIVSNARFVYLDNDLEFYAELINNERLFVIPESNLETALFNVITNCKMLNFAQDNIDLTNFNYDEIISDELSKLGFSYKLVGFRYIKQCLEQAIKNNFILGSLQKDVYPYIGIQNSTSAYNVERGIRTAIVDASKKECFQLDCFHEKDKIVSNRFFLEYLLDKLRIYKSRQNN